VRKKPQKTKFRVTKRDISAGVVDDPFSCPIARAIKRKLQTEDVHVGDRDGYIEVGCLELKIPKRLGDWITDFDAGNKVKPINFALPVHAESGLW
jgi:hypothetical protein